MKILVVDYYNDSYHNQYNTIQIDSILDCDAEVTLCGRKGHFAQKYDKVCSFINIPSWLFHEIKKCRWASLYNRFWDCLKLIFISFRVAKNDYDLVVFLRYDIFSIFTFFTMKKTFLINHYSATTMNSRSKRIILSSLPNHYIHVALNDIIKKHIQSCLPKKRVIMIPHGVLPPFDKIEKCIYIDNNTNFIFCSITSSCDVKLLDCIISSADIKLFLELYKIKFIIKSNRYICQSENIIQIDGFINQEDYMFMINKALCVFLPYSASFGYRVSGVFFECVANNTPVIGTRIPAFLSYYNENQPLQIIDSVFDFTDAVINIMKCQRNWDTSMMNPSMYWKKYLNQNVNNLS